MLSGAERRRIQEKTHHKKVQWSQEEVVMAVWFGQDFKVIVSTLTARDADGKQWIELLGYGENGLAEFEQAMETWRASSKPHN